MSELYPWLVPTYHKISQTFSEGLGHHALLIKADQGLGAEVLFEALTKRIMCQTPDNAPCGHCHACHLMAAQSHPDFHVLASQEGKDIGVNQVRAINEVVSQHAQQNGNKLVYIQDAERLTEAAANALLKTLEEPRPNTYFLVSDYLQPLPSVECAFANRGGSPKLAFFSISGRNIRIIDRTCDEFGAPIVSIGNITARIN